jgi:hypothetical protein
MQNMIKRTMLCCLTSLAAFIIACAHDTASLKVENSLPAEKLSRYNDSFDSLRGDIWDKAGYYVRNAPLRTNFKQAAVSIENGQLKVETKPGSFSVGVISSKYHLRGDFDVQVDCHADFLKDLGNMDQAVWLIASDQTVEFEDDKAESVNLQVAKWGIDSADISAAYRKSGKFNRCYRKQIGDFFQGSLRIVRIGDQVSLLFTTAVSGEWIKACTLSRPSNDVQIRLGAQNYFDKRVSIDSKSVFTAWFDNFKINAAQEIIEDEI